MAFPTFKYYENVFFFFVVALRITHVFKYYYNDWVRQPIVAISNSDWYYFNFVSFLFNEVNPPPA